MRGDVCDGPSLASSVRGMPSCPSKVSGRAHSMTASRASLHHRDLTTHPGAGVLDRFAWSRVIRLSRLEKVKDVLRARCRPKSEEMVIRISEGPTAANRHEARVPNLRKDHWLGSLCLFPSSPRVARGQAVPSTVASFQHQNGPSVSRSLTGHPPPCTRQFRTFTLRGTMWVIFDHLRPSDHIMPDHAGDRGTVRLILAPHDYLHFKQKSASVTCTGPPIGAADCALMITAAGR